MSLKTLPLPYSTLTFLLALPDFLELFVDLGIVFSREERIEHAPSDYTKNCICASGTNWPQVCARVRVYEISHLVLLLLQLMVAFFQQLLPIVQNGFCWTIWVNQVFEPLFQPEDFVRLRMSA